MDVLVLHVYQLSVAASSTAFTAPSAQADYHAAPDKYTLGADAGILDALNIKKAHIVGHDWGAAVAWAFAALYPQRTLKLVAISAGHPSGLMKGAHRGAQKQKSWCVTGESKAGSPPASLPPLPPPCMLA